MKLTIKILTISLLTAFLFTACEEENNEPGENEVWMKNNAFNPEEKDVLVGTTVKWINKDDTEHTITSSDGLFEGGSVAAGETYEYTFDSTGVYSYVCTIHTGMSGKIVVGNVDTGTDDDSGGDY